MREKEERSFDIPFYSELIVQFKAAEFVFYLKR